MCFYTVFFKQASKLIMDLSLLYSQLLQQKGANLRDGYSVDAVMVIAWDKLSDKNMTIRRKSQSSLCRMDHRLIKNDKFHEKERSVHPWC